MLITYLQCLEFGFIKVLSVFQSDIRKRLMIMGNDKDIKGLGLDVELHPDGYLKPAKTTKGGRIYKTDLVGKIAEGWGYKYNLPCRIVVDQEWTISDKNNPSMGVCGRIIDDNGKASYLREKMVRGVFQGRKTKWKIVGEYDEVRDDTAEKIDGPLTKRLMRMNVGDKFRLSLSNRSPDTVKTTCSRLSTSLHRRYLASGPDGLVMEISRVEPEAYEPRKNFTDKIRSIEIGEEIDIPSSEKPTEMVRSIAGRLTVSMGRKYKVSRNETGCTVRRIK